MDIRTFFGGRGGGGAGKSALSEVRESRGSPVAKKQTDATPPKKRPESATKRKNLVVELSDSDDSDGENPLPRTVRKTLAAGVKKKKKISWSSSDEDELPPSASQARPQKRGEKASLAEAPKEKKVRRPAIVLENQAGPSKGAREPPPSKPGKSAADSDIEEISGDEDFVPAAPKKGRRQKTPPGQSKLSFQRTAKTASDAAKGTRKEELKPVDALEFFSNFGKTTKEIKKEAKQKKHEKEKAEAAQSKDKKGVVSPKKSAGDKGTTRDANGFETPKKQPEELKAEVSPFKQKKKGTESSVPKLTTKSLSSPTKVTAPAPAKTLSSPSKPATKKAEVAGSPVRKEHAKQPKDVEAPSAKVPVTLPWVDKYKPTNPKQLIGQNGEKSPMNKLLRWLRDWPNYHLGEGAKVKRPRPAPWLAQSDGTSFKSVLLSGPPGVGKTTCAVMACDELGLKYVEMNASDARNKKLLESKIAELTGCRQIDEFFGKNPSPNTAKSGRELTHVLIMDEVDGMSGNEDRAGLAELIQMIKGTRVPIICICNDRQSQKMRSLVNYCFDLRFQRPRVEQIRSRIQTIAFQEKLKLKVEEVDELIEASNHDVRQSIYNLQLLGTGGSCKDIQIKDCAVNTFEAARRLLNAGTSIFEKQEMFFTDYSLMPLFVQENYPSIHSNKMSEGQRLSALRRAAESIARGDIVDRTIRTTGAWSLLNEQALFSSILPSNYMNGYMSSMINFPSWLGKNSTSNKRKRLMRQLAYHTHLKTSADCCSLVMDYVPVFRDCMVRPLVHREAQGVQDVVRVYDEYDMTREDSEAIAELAVWPEMTDMGSKIQSKVKAALTRALNKEHRLLPYALDEVSKGKKKAAPGSGESGLEVDEEGNVVESGGGDDALNDDDDSRSSDDDAPGPSTKRAPSGTSSATGRGRGRGGAKPSTAKRGSAAGRARGRGR